MEQGSQQEIPLNQRENGMLTELPGFEFLLAISLFLNLQATMIVSVFFYF